MKQLLVLFFFLSLSMSCSTTQELTNPGKAVKLQKADPPDNCKEIGPVESGSFMSYRCGNRYFVLFWTYASPTGAKNCLRNMAAKMNGNYVRLEVVTSNNYGGTVYSCPE